MDRGADPNHRATEWAVGGPLHFAAFAGSRAPAERVTETIVALLDAGSDVNLVDDNGNTPLDAAVSRENHAAADLLREHGGKTGREFKGITMDTTNALRHWNNWYPKDRETFDLTSAEEQFIAASIGTERRNWVGTPDIGRMEAILADEPDVLDRIGSVLLHRLLLNRRGCGSAIKFMLYHGIALDLDPTEYNNFFDAVYMGAMDVAETVFESGAADATGVSVLKPHVGWPDNTSMLFWAATSGHVDMVKLLLKYGAGIHHELPIKGWGEKGATSLQVAAAPAWREEHQPQKHEVARILIEDGAFYDVYTASALNDTTRLQELIDQDAVIIDATDDYGMTPLHWAARRRLHAVRPDAPGTWSPRQLAEQGPPHPPSAFRRVQPGGHDTPARQAQR